MRGLNLAILAALELSGAHARNFNVHEDLLAFPQVRNPIKQLPHVLSLT